MAPSGNPHQGPALRPFGLPEPSTAETGTSFETAATPAASDTPIRYQKVFHLTPANLAPYAALTFPSLAAGSSALNRIKGELLGISAMATGKMVGFAIAERQGDGAAQLLSLKVDVNWRRRGIGTGLMQRLMMFVAKEGITPLTLRYGSSPELSTCFEPILARLGWSTPRTDFVLLEGRSQQLAAIDWADRFPVTDPYRLLPWNQLSESQSSQTGALGAPAELQPQVDQHDLEPEISLALLHNNSLVGWLIAHRTGADSVRYSSLFVAPGHRSRARSLALLAEGFRRQHSAAIPIARAAIDRRNTAMLRLLKRHLGAHLLSIGRSRLSQSPPLQS